MTAKVTDIHGRPVQTPQVKDDQTQLGINELLADLQEKAATGKIRSVVISYELTSGENFSGCVYRNLATALGLTEVAKQRIWNLELGGEGA